MEVSHTKSELDRVDLEIRKLIAEESDHKDKGMLLLMQSINRNLTENTLATIRVADGMQKVDTKVHEHVTEFQKWKNTGMGAFRAGMLFVGVVQVITTIAVSVLGWSVVTHLRGNDDDHTLLVQVAATHSGYISRMDYIDRRLDALIAQLIEVERTATRNAQAVVANQARMNTK